MSSSVVISPLIGTISFEIAYSNFLFFTLSVSKTGKTYFAMTGL